MATLELILCQAHPNTSPSWLRFALFLEFPHPPTLESLGVWTIFNNNNMESVVGTTFNNNNIESFVTRESVVEMAVSDMAWTSLTAFLMNSLSILLST